MAAYVTEIDGSQMFCGIRWFQSGVGDLLDGL